MATQDDVRRIALALPGVVEDDGFAFSVAAAAKSKHIVWTWKERIDPKQARVPNPKVIAVRVANELDKQALLSVDARKFFTEPHYNGYPAVLVHLDAVTAAELEPLIREAWRCRAPKHLIEGTPAKTTGRATKAKARAKAKRSSTPKQSTRKRSR